MGPHGLLQVLHPLGCLEGTAGRGHPPIGGRLRALHSTAAPRVWLVDGYNVLNTRIGFRAADGWTIFVWSRNLLDKDYFELLTAAPGNTGLYVGQPGDGRTAGVTLRVALKSR